MEVFRGSCTDGGADLEPPFLLAKLDDGRHVEVHVRSRGGRYAAEYDDDDRRRRLMINYTEKRQLRSNNCSTYTRHQDHNEAEESLVLTNQTFQLNLHHKNKRTSCLNLNPIS